VIVTGGQLAAMYLEGLDLGVVVIQERYDARGRREIMDMTADVSVLGTIQPSPATARIEVAGDD
jgi:hypothetical protein